MMKGCNQDLSRENLNFLLKDMPELLDKYTKFKTNVMVLTTDNLKFCPIVNCGSFGERVCEDNKYIQCENGHKFCFQCLGSWHGKTNCDEV